MINEPECKYDLFITLSRVYSCCWMVLTTAHKPSKRKLYSIENLRKKKYTYMYTYIYTYLLAPVQTLPVNPPSQHIIFSFFNHFCPSFHSIVIDNSLFLLYISALLLLIKNCTSSPSATQGTWYLYSPLVCTSPLPSFCLLK